MFAAWKAAARAATRRGNPVPKPRRRRGEDTGGAFKRAATILRRAVMLPAAAYAAAAFLSDTLDWLNLWQADAAGLDGERPEADPNRLFPQP